MPKEKALQYHAQFPSGKLSIKVTKPVSTPAELSLAYTPGVAEPCLAIENNPQTAYMYTNKSNLVAIVSNGTAVLGLGDIGALASKPVMEGKAALFKKYAGVDAYDIEVDEKDQQKLVEIIAAIAPTFGGINLEDIKAPECFYVENELIKRLNIPVFHDDQHGTAIVAAAGVKNACEIQGKKLEDCKIVVSGAGAGAIATMNMLVLVGAKRENFYVFDTKGLVTKQRKDLNEFKEPYAQPGPDASLHNTLKGCDIFIGLSKGNLLSGDMLRLMADKPIIFAMANPNPEILPPDAKLARPDAIVATGRSDFPNQVNNSLCFPHLFRAALDTQASIINDAMKIACVKAIADLAKEDVSTEIQTLYGRDLSFDQDYIIPSQFDPRLYIRVASSVAEAALKTKVARNKDFNLSHYAEFLQQRLVV
jgi:malate dehydrogenase (oxaloacetate-decarboxylating)(NADP+)